MAGSTPDPPLKAFLCVFLFSGTGCSSAGIVYLTGEHFGIIRNNRDNCRGNVTHRQSIGKQISYRFYKKIASFNLYFYKEDFLNWLLDLEDLFDYENIYGERKVELVLYKLSEYVLHWWEQIHSLIESDKVKTKFINGLG